jgi:hypothetical protein
MVLLSLELMLIRCFFSLFQVSEVKRHMTTVILAIEDCDFDVSIELFAPQRPHYQLPEDVSLASPLCTQQFRLLMYRLCFENTSLAPHTERGTWIEGVREQGGVRGRLELGGKKQQKTVRTSTMRSFVILQYCIKPVYFHK